VSKKVLILTYYWPPSGGAGVQRWLKFSKYLFHFDVEPIVLTVDEQYAEYPNLDLSLIQDVHPKLKVHKTKTWEPFNIYKTFSKKDKPKHGNVYSKNSFKGKVINLIRANFFVPDPRKYWKKYAIKKALEIISQQEIECIITTGPPHSVHLIGLELKKKTKIKWIADFRDPWSNFMFNEDLPRLPFIKKIDAKNEQNVLENADKIITTTNGISKDFESFKEKITVLSNGYDDSDIPAFELKQNKKFILSYIGNFRNNQDVTILWRTLNKLQEDKLITTDNFELALVGNIASNIEESIRSNKLEGFIFRHGYLAHKEALSIMMQSNALLIIIPDVQSKMSINTGKIFEYLASKNPVITIGPKGGDADLILQNCQRNKAVEYNDSELLYQQIKTELERFKSNDGYNYQVDNDLHLQYSRKQITEKLTSIL
tara:strand:- start:2034 stop:3317 length:1284 start_codon:yes stop_codon:yes gene_type:complete